MKTLTGGYGILMGELQGKRFRSYDDAFKAAEKVGAVIWWYTGTHKDGRNKLVHMTVDGHSTDVVFKKLGRDVVYVGAFQDGVN